MKISDLNRLQKFTLIIISILILIITVILIYLLSFYEPTRMSFTKQKEKSLSKIALAGKSVTPENKETTLVYSDSGKNIKLPIILYHKTPQDFENQMKLLIERGYTAVTMNEATEIITGKIIGPSKPVAITFDDGFSDQLKALEILRKLNLKSTFYIIIGSRNSGWCLGVEKKANNCGDAYMNWDEIKSIASSGLVEIGSHTVDHTSLSSQSEKVQRYEIFESKRILEEKLGIKINSFAYPYGKYSEITKRLVAEAGYKNATTVNSSYIQSSNMIFELYRIRKANDLP